MSDITPFTPHQPMSYVLPPITSPVRRYSDKDERGTLSPELVGTT